MPTRLSLHSHLPWREMLLEAPLHADLAARLPEFLKKTAQEFLHSVPAQLSAPEVVHLNQWYTSSAGQGALVAFAAALWDQMGHFAHYAMPAHDARHAMFKVPAASLEYLEAEQLDGWERIGVLGALLHDHGRWAEERIYGFPGASVLHARLSYLLGAELLSRFEMPVPIKQHILLSAIRHTSGASAADPMPLKLTVSADREQLYGPEIILRLAHHASGTEGDDSSYYGERPGRSVLAQAERYLTHRLPGPLFSREAHGFKLWRVLAKFLLLAEAPEASCERFTRILHGEPGAPSSIHPFQWEKEWAAADSLSAKSAPVSLPEALDQCLSAPNLAPSEQYRREAFEKLLLVSVDNRPRLAAALAFIHSVRVALDAQQSQSLARIAREYAQDPLISGLSARLLNGWAGINPKSKAQAA
jgi:hypothetical protein